MAALWSLSLVFLLCIISLGSTASRKSIKTDVVSSPKRKIIIDSAGGVNDAFALIWALQSFNSKLIDIKALTTVQTDLPSYDVFRNVIHMVNITKHSKMKKNVLSIPIAVAPVNTADDADVNQRDDDTDDAAALLNDGLFGFSAIFNKYPDIFATKKKTLEAFETASNSDDLLIETILKHPNEISLITTGPLTNLYLAESKRPGILSLTKDIYILGGEFVNRTGDSKGFALSEFNFNYDSNALYEILNAMMDASVAVPPNIFIFPLDTTNKMQFGLQQVSLLYTLLSTDIQTEIEMCRMKMEKDADKLDSEEDIYDDSDLYDSDRSSREDESVYDDLMCTQTALLYIFYERMMEESTRSNYLNGECSCLQLADSSIIGYLLYPHLYDFKYVNCKVNRENGMIWFDQRLNIVTKDTITIPNCLVNVDVDSEKLIHGFTRDSVYMIHDAYMDYMEYVMNQMEW